MEHEGETYKHLLPSCASFCDQLTGRTKGSAVMDVSTLASTTINTMKVHEAPLQAKGPIGRGLSTLFIRRSSTTLQGIFVHCVIDADFTGHYTLWYQPQIAQLIPFQPSVPKTDPKVWRNWGFGSAGDPQVYWTQVVCDVRPHMVCTITMPQARP